MHPVIRRLHVTDIDQIVAIEQAAYPFPWSQGVFEDCLRVGYSCFGLQMGARLAGYAILSWAAGEAHLLNLCVHPHWQRQGYGGLLLEHVIRYVKQLETDAVFLEVRGSNPRATNLYTSRGFSVIGRRPSYYKSERGREDAIVMRLEFKHSG